MYATKSSIWVTFDSTSGHFLWDCTALPAPTKMPAPCNRKKHTATVLTADLTTSWLHKPVMLTTLTKAVHVKNSSIQNKFSGLGSITAV